MSLDSTRGVEACWTSCCSLTPSGITRRAGGPTARPPERWWCAHDHVLGRRRPGERAPHPRPLPICQPVKFGVDERPAGAPEPGSARKGLGCENLLRLRVTLTVRFPWAKSPPWLILADGCLAPMND